MVERPDMRDFLHLREHLPDLGAMPMVAPGAACGGGVPGCADLSAAHSEVTEKLRVFLTRMTQGISGYLDVMNKNIQVYEDSAAYTAADMRAVFVNHQGTGLPDVAPELAPRQGG